MGKKEKWWQKDKREEMKQLETKQMRRDGKVFEIINEMM